MAQWFGQYTGNTHATQVAERETALRHAVAAFLSEYLAADRRKRAKSVRKLAARVLLARARLLRARIAAAQEVGTADALELRRKQLAWLQQRLRNLEKEGVRGILKQFGATRVLRFRINRPTKRHATER